MGRALSAVKNNIVMIGFLVFAVGLLGVALFEAATCGCGDKGPQRMVHGKHDEGCR